MYFSMDVEANAEGFAGLDGVSLHLPDSDADLSAILAGRCYWAVGFAGPSSETCEGFTQVAELTQLVHRQKTLGMNQVFHACGTHILNNRVGKQYFLMIKL